MKAIINKKSYPWVVVGMLTIVSLLNYLDRQMLSVMRPFMMQDIEALVSITNFGRLMAIFLWIYAFMSPVSGMIADKMNRKWLIVISLFVWSAVTLGMGYTVNINQLYILRALMGISEAFYMPAALSMIADYHKDKTRSIAIGIHMSGIYLGQMVGGFGATLAFQTSWQFTFHSFGLVGILYSLLLMIILREKKAYTTNPKTAKSLSGELLLACRGFGILFSNIAFWSILLCFSGLQLSGWATKNWMPTMFSDSLNINMEYAGPLSTVTLALSSFFGVLLGGFVSDRWVRKKLKGRIYTSVMGMSFVIPALLLLAFGNGVGAMVTGAILFGLGFGMFDVNNMPILCQFLPARYRATGYGMLNLGGISAGAIITNELGKALEAGYKNEVFLVMVLAVCVAIFLQLKLLKPKTIDMTDSLF